MGIKGLTALLSEHAPKCITVRHTLVVCAATRLHF